MGVPFWGRFRFVSRPLAQLCAVGVRGLADPAHQLRMCAIGRRRGGDGEARADRERYFPWLPA